MAVRAQTVLLTLSSAHLQDGDPAERARIAYETAKTEYERAQRLVDDRIVSQKDFNTIRERYENARLAYEALLPSGNGQGVAVRAAESGYVKACLVKEGDYVAVGQPLVTLGAQRPPVPAGGRAGTLLQPVGRCVHGALPHLGQRRGVSAG